MRRRPRKHLPDGSINPLWQPVKSSRQKKPPAAIDTRAEPFVRFPFPCVNCDSPVPNARLFCSDLCRDEAKYVRYYRKVIDEGSVEDLEIREALLIKRAHILAGGYDWRLRQLPQELRRAVIDRDRGVCRRCGQPGAEIDHINGASLDPANLQLLCADCHRKKTMQQIRPVSREAHPEVFAKAAALDERVMSAEPLRLCDHSDWNRLWRSVEGARRRAAEEQNQEGGATPG